MINGSEPLYSSFRFGALGTQWEIATGEPLNDGLRQLILKRIDDFEQTYSRFRDDSLVAHIAAAHEGGRFLFPEDASGLFDLYDRLYEATGGAVDPLVGRRLELLGYDRTYSLTPAPAAVREAEALARPKWSSDVIRDGTTVITHAPLVIDVGAAGKGYLVDLVAEMLQTGGQGEAVRVPQADGTLVVLPVGADEELMPSLLTLTDVMGTGHHAALAAQVGPGKTVAVIGDGAVGLCGVIASKRLGADRIILLGRNPERTALGEEFGATDVVRERGEEAVERVRGLTQHGAHSVLECVGLDEAVETALAIARPGGAIGRVGVPEHETTPTGVAFWKNASIAGGPAPVRAYIEELLPDVLEGRIDPGRVFDRTGSIEDVSDGYRAMNDREVLKFQIKP
jgi:D-arabinose 1-dehydrogenase-like Zn-dependent alcohol dehydrogenase